MRQTHKKFQRNPNRAAGWQMTERSLAILGLLYRYRFLPTPLLARLIPGNLDVTYKHIKQLFHVGLTRRFILPSEPYANGRNAAGDLYHYLDSLKALDFLEASGWAPPYSLSRRLIRQNRENKFYDQSRPHLFLRHEAMLSRFRGYLELSCRSTSRGVSLTEWQQGPELARRVTVPEASYDKQAGRWSPLPSFTELPLNPDGLFALTVTTAPEEHTLLPFFLEVDRNTETIPRFLQKLRAYFHFIVNQKRYLAEYGLPLIRAVLTLTNTPARAEQLRQAAFAHASFIGFAAASKLFWFAPETFFTTPTIVPTANPARPLKLAVGLHHPGLLLEPRWLSPKDDTPHALTDLPDAPPLLRNPLIRPVPAPRDGIIT